MNKRQAKKKKSVRAQINEMKHQMLNLGFTTGLRWGVEMGESCKDECGADIAKRLNQLLQKAIDNPPAWLWRQPGKKSVALDHD